MGDLIFDIGLHNGDDADYYLHLGYRVVGVEANPLLAKECEARFAEAIQRGQLTIVNAGVLDKQGTFTFYRNLTDSGNSSFDPERGKRGEWEEIPVRCMTTKDLIGDHGMPLFMKVDIEGADLGALGSLSAAECPAYVSLELNVQDPIVERLVDLGYDAFKFVDGDTYRPAPPVFDNELGWRLLRKAGRLVPPLRKGIQRLPERFRAKSEWNPEGKYAPDGYPFGKYNSGPFGESAAGKWLSAEEGVRWFRRLADGYTRQGWENSLWWDVQARHRSVRR